MITISDNDLKQLLRFTQSVDVMIKNCKDIHSDIRLCNNIRLANRCARKLLKRPDVQRIMSGRKSEIVADINHSKQTK